MHPTQTIPVDMAPRYPTMVPQDPSSSIIQLILLVSPDSLDIKSKQIHVDFKEVINTPYSIDLNTTYGSVEGSVSDRTEFRVLMIMGGFQPERLAQAEKKAKGIVEKPVKVNLPRISPDGMEEALNPLQGKEEILSQLLSRLHMKGDYQLKLLSSTALFSLIADLFRDSLDLFIERVAESLVLLLSIGADQKSEMIEQIMAEFVAYVLRIALPGQLKSDIRTCNVLYDLLLILSGLSGSSETAQDAEWTQMWETEIKDDDAYKKELLDQEEGDEKAPYSAAVVAPVVSEVVVVTAVVKMEDAPPESSLAASGAITSGLKMITKGVFDSSQNGLQKGASRDNNTRHVGSIRATAATQVAVTSIDLGAVTLAYERTDERTGFDLSYDLNIWLFGVHEAIVLDDKLPSQNTLANEALRIGNEAPRLDVKLVSQNDSVGDEEELCSLSGGDYENDESVSMYCLGASLGITLDGTCRKK
ncbi:hypothetical protein Tco_0654648 [Tanacetum coccineum]|uniref:Uncharacterized protein n=1 Tax=Tanacetum coccineum TaxID=301880 RepID=A0ABQ4X3T1_9ASTR